MLSVSSDNTLYDVVIIGAGPAGISAAIYTARANISCCLVEAAAPGGKVLKTGVIENYAGVTKKTGPDLAFEMLNQVSALNVPIIYSNVIGVEKSDKYFIVFLGNNKTVFAKAVIVATGTVERAMMTPGEEKFYNKGISYCAICDGALYKGKDVAVVGGGNGAVEESIYLAGIVNKIYLVHRRDEFRADAYAVNQLKRYQNVEYLLSYVPERVDGDSKVQTFTVRSVKDNSLKTLNVDCVFPYIGATPATKFLNALNVTDEAGYVKVNDALETSVPGLFAAGDCIVKKYRQIATAVSDGTIAALNVKEFLNKL